MRNALQLLGTEHVTEELSDALRSALARMFVREVDGMAVQEWYDNLTDGRELVVNTAERYFHIMHHMMRKASTIWATVTGLDRNLPIRWKWIISMMRGSATF